MNMRVALGLGVRSYLQEGQVANEAVLLAAAAEKAEHLPHHRRRPLALARRVHLHMRCTLFASTA